MSVADILSNPHRFGDLLITDDRRRKLRRAATRPKNTGINAETAMDEVHLFGHEPLAGGELIHGVYGVDEWITGTFLRTALQKGESTLVQEGTWITEAGWSLYAWVLKHSERFNFMSKGRALIYMPWGVIEATVSRSKLELELNGEPAEVMKFITSVDGELRRAENLVEWVYSARGDSISVPLNYRPAIDAAYPWLPKKIGPYIDDYLNSSASVIILIGAPGTGKTTFIKNLIHRSGGDAKVTYDEKVMGDDSLFAGFIESDTRFMIMEDADAFLKAREDGNTMMHRFLNVSDGLISAEGKKLVFSTNLPSIRDIDSALMRPGRCFDVVEFRALKRNEAEEVAAEVGVPLPDGSEFTLAEIFNVMPSAETVKHRRVGFT
jgi:hypothetical protein